MLKEKLTKNQLTIGTWLQINSTEIASILASQNFEWLTIDAEHGLFNHTDIAKMSDVIHKAGKQSLVRLPKCDSIWVRKALDAGVDGLIIPMVNSKEIALNAIRFSKYPPMGERGFGFSHANNYGQNFKSYAHNSNDKQVLIIQIEHINAVNNISDILSVSGIDAVMIGPYDLAGSMGYIGQTEHPKVLKTYKKIILACNENNIPVGMHIVKQDKEALNKAIDEGYTFIAYGMDSLFLQDIY